MNTESIATTMTATPLGEQRRRFRSYLDNGLNYRVNYFYHYDSNPSLNMHWENADGEKLVVDKVVTAPAGTAGSARDIKVLQIRNAARNRILRRQRRTSQLPEDC